MYAIRSYYEHGSTNNCEQLHNRRCTNRDLPRDGLPYVCVITSYSIHYTKLYEIVQCVMANDTLKLARIKSYGEAWSIVAFYNPFNEDEAKDYFEMLTRELEILDNSSQTDSVFNHSLERLINFAEKRQNVIFDSNAIKPDYQLICNDLFDWIDSEYIESGKQSYNFV